MSKTCNFEFSRHPPIYYSNEQIKGKVYLTTKKPVRVEGIYIEFSAAINVSWFESSKLALPQIAHDDSSNNVNLPRTTHYHSTLNSPKDVIHCIDAIYLQPATHEYPFKFMIPKESLASCKHKNGSIAYRISLILKRNGKADRIFSEAVIIKNKLNLLRFKSLRQQYFVSSTDGKIIFSVPHRGFVPGQCIEYTLRARGIRFLINLCKCIEYKSIHPTQKIKREVTVIASTNGSSKKESKTSASIDEINKGTITVPLSTQISSIGKSSMIRIVYFLEAVIANTKNNKAMLKLMIPIVVGTVPLKKSVEDELDQPYCYDNKAAIFKAFPKEKMCIQNSPKSTELQSVNYNINCDKTVLLPNDAACYKYE